MLVDDELKIVKLFTPAFSETAQEPGYIKSYPPGVRENGGQYTHAATWFVIALAEMGRERRGVALLCDAEPGQPCAATSRRPSATASSPMWWRPTSIRRRDKGGRGGWTWYTGSAGWLYRAAVESILGIQKEGNRLIVKPVLPSHWDGYSATLRLGGATYRIKVVRKPDAEKSSIEVDGVQREGEAIDMIATGESDIVVVVPSQIPGAPVSLG